MKDGKVIVVIADASSALDRYAGRSHRRGECLCNSPTSGM
jgi:hypothetical protein